MILRLYSFLIILCALSTGIFLWLQGRVPKEEEDGRQEWISPLVTDSDFLADLARSGQRGASGIAVVAPASGLDAESRQKAYDLASRLQVALQPETFSDAAPPYHANSDEIRAFLFAQALADPEVEVIWALRGGYGSNRILKLLENAPALKKPKLFIGYSDMTFLHLFLTQHGWKTIHGPMFWELGSAGKDEKNFRLLASLLAGEVENLRYEGLKPLNQAAKNCDTPVEGAVIGGNLTCIAAAVGTPWQLDAKDKILFFEDVGEKGYQIDRLLSQLKSAGQLDDAKAILFGSFTRSDANAAFALERFARDCPKPVFASDDFGHGERNFPLAFNTPAAIEKDAKHPDSSILSMHIEELP